ncbi:MAG: hypothetical protein JWQ87_5419 [Candidatus Sulfotelmatobacter sp.]|nr:hypothetical protein [Candidatus Sulfotelmatobacter sp.]
MKPLLLLTLGLGIGMAQGQESPDLSISTAIVLEGRDLVVTPGNCGRRVRFGKSSKLIKDIFPEECGAKLESHSWGDPPPDCMAEKLKFKGAIQWECPPAPEPRDVPAVLKSCKHQATCTEAEALSPFWMCADKSRVLLTSEDGKKHCVKF